MAIDFKKLRAIPIQDVATRLGFTLKRKGEQFRGPCIICHHPSQRAFTISPWLQRYWCFGHCKSGGDALQLATNVLMVTKPEAAKWLLKSFGGPP